MRETDRRGGAEPEIRRKLARSKEAVRDKQPRVIRCPNCGFHLLDVYGNEHCYIRVKCRKCKFSDTIDTALFRTMRYRAGRTRGYIRRIETLDD